MLSPLAKIPTEMAATEAAITTTAVFSEWAAKREGGSVEPSRTAAIGGTRVARSAGMMLASSVIVVPSASETRTVRSANTIPASGRSPPSAVNNLASPKPGEQPDHRGQQPDHQALDHDRAHDLLARCPERPQRRELARALGDGDRQGVEDHERAHEQRDRAEAQQEVADGVDDDVGLAGVRRSLLLGVLDLQARGDQRLDGADELVRGRAVLGGDRDAVETAFLVQQRLGGREVPDRDRGAAERVDPAEAGDAGQLVASLGPERGHGDHVADLEVLAGGRVGIDGDLLRPLGPLARLELERAELRQRRVIAESELGRAFGADGLAVAAEDLGVVGLVRRDRASGRLDLGQRPHLGEQRRGNRRGPALRALDDLLAGDHRVGLLVRRREDAVERLLDRVGQDERPAHHHDADHDGQGRQQGTHLAAEQSLQRDGGHRSVTASSASRISCAVERPRSRTI